MSDGHLAGGRFATAYGLRTVRRAILCTLGEREATLEVATGRYSGLGWLNIELRPVTGRYSGLGWLNIELRPATGRKSGLGKLNIDFGFGRPPSSPTPPHAHRLDGLLGWVPVALPPGWIIPRTQIGKTGPIRQHCIAPPNWAA